MRVRERRVVLWIGREVWEWGCKSIYLLVGSTQVSGFFIFCALRFALQWGGDGDGDGEGETQREFQYGRLGTWWCDCACDCVGYFGWIV